MEWILKWKRRRRRHLIKTDVVDGEIEPKSVSRIAGIRTDVQVVFKFTDVIDPPQVAY